MSDHDEQSSDHETHKPENSEHKPKNSDLDYPQKHGPWTINHRDIVYKDPWLSLRVDQVTRPDDLPGTYSNVLLKPGVCVLAIDANGDLRLTKEFHYAVGRYTIEGVSGGIELDETPEQSAARELAEELGITAGKLESICTLDPFTAAVYSPTQIFFATELSFHATDCEGTEQIEPVIMSLEEAISKIDSSQITHAPTCVAILRLALRRTLSCQKNT